MAAVWKLMSCAMAATFVAGQPLVRTNSTSEQRRALQAVPTFTVWAYNFAVFNAAATTPIGVSGTAGTSPETCTFSSVAAAVAFNASGLYANQFPNGFPTYLRMNTLKIGARWSTTFADQTTVKPIVRLHKTTGTGYDCDIHKTANANYCAIDESPSAQVGTDVTLPLPSTISSTFSLMDIDISSNNWDMEPNRIYFMNFIIPQQPAGATTKFAYQLGRMTGFNRVMSYQTRSTTSTDCTNGGADPNSGTFGALQPDSSSGALVLSLGFVPTPTPSASATATVAANTPTASASATSSATASSTSSRSAQASSSATHSAASTTTALPPGTPSSSASASSSASSSASASASAYATGTSTGSPTASSSVSGSASSSASAVPSAVGPPSESATPSSTSSGTAHPSMTATASSTASSTSSSSPSASSNITLAVSQRGGSAGIDESGVVGLSVGAAIVVLGLGVGLVVSGLICKPKPSSSSPSSEAVGVDHAKGGNTGGASDPVRSGYGLSIEHAVSPSMAGDSSTSTPALAGPHDGTEASLPVRASYEPLSFADNPMRPPHQREITIRKVNQVVVSVAHPV